MDVHEFWAYDRRLGSFRHVLTAEGTGCVRVAFLGDLDCVGRMFWIPRNCSSLDIFLALLEVLGLNRRGHIINLVEKGTTLFAY